MWKTVALVFSLYLASALDSFAKWPADLIRVQASGCAGSPSVVRIQTGINVSDYGGYLTALHGVVGCKTILVSFSADPDATPTKMEITKLDFGNDVALLEAPGAPPVTGRPKAKSVTPVEALTIIGFPGATNSPWYLTVTVTPVETTKQWFDADPGAVKMIAGREYQPGSTSPDLNRQMITVQGPVRPGHSGAPVFNAGGEVIGLAEGGLSNEAASFVVPIWDIKLVDRGTVQAQYEVLSKVPLGSMYSAESDKSREKLERLGITVTRPNLLKYAQDGGAQEVSLLLSVLIEPDSHDPGGPTPLMLAASAAHYDVVRTLIAAGANPSFQSSGGGVPEAAVEGGNPDVVAAVLGFDPGGPAPNGLQATKLANRALKAAIARNSGPIVKLIVENRASVFSSGADDGSPFSQAIGADAGEALSALLAFARSHSIDVDVETLFRSSVAADRPATSRILTDALGSTTVDACTPLGYAVKKNAARVVRALATKSNVNKKACGEDTAVFVADKADAVEAERVLLDLQPFVRNPFTGDSIRHWMLDNYHRADQANNDLLLQQVRSEDIPEDLAIETLSGVWDVDTRKAGGPLSAAAFRLSPRMVRSLLARDDFKIYPGSLCEGELPADDHNYPVQAAMSGLNVRGPDRQDDAREIIGMLLDRDPIYGNVACGEWTAARMAGQNVEILKYLDERRADLGFDWHSTALIEAVLSKNDASIQYLLQNEDAVCKPAAALFSSYGYYETGDDDNAATAALFSDNIAVLRRVIARQSEIRPGLDKGVFSYPCKPSFEWLLREACERGKQKSFDGLVQDAPPLDGKEVYFYEHAIACALERGDKKNAETLLAKGAKVAAAFDRLKSKETRDAVCKANALLYTKKGIRDEDAIAGACAKP